MYSADKQDEFIELAPKAGPRTNPTAKQRLRGDGKEPSKPRVITLAYVIATAQNLKLVIAVTYFFNSNPRKSRRHATLKD